jgi:hypothetical protein
VETHYILLTDARFWRGPPPSAKKRPCEILELLWYERVSVEISLVFALPDGSPMLPDNLSRDWRRATKAL